MSSILEEVLRLKRVGGGGGGGSVMVFYHGFHHVKKMVEAT